jgi:hypothetical protein
MWNCLGRDYVSEGILRRNENNIYICNSFAFKRLISQSIIWGRDINLFSQVSKLISES